MKMRFATTLLLTLAAVSGSALTARAGESPVREVVKTGIVRQTLQAVVMNVGGDTTIYPIHARVDYTTIIVLPEDEKILDWIIGDKANWVLEGAANLAYIRPAEPGRRTNINLVTAKGNVYTFDISEVTNSPETPVDEKVILRKTPKADLSSSSINPGDSPDTPRFVSYDDYLRAKLMARNTAVAAQTAIEQDRQNVATDMHFDYTFKANKKPFYIESIYDDGKFTYIHMAPHSQESPALYLIKDGKPDLTTYTYSNGVYIVNTVVNDGYLRLGKAKLRFKRIDQ